MLVKRGHRFDDLWQKYTMDQVWLFYEAAQKNIRQEIFNMALATRMAFGADKSQWQKYMKTLTSHTESSQREVLPKEKYDEIKRLLDGK